MIQDDLQAKAMRKSFIRHFLRNNRRLILLFLLFTLSTFIVLFIRFLVPSQRTIIYDVPSEINGKVVITDEGYDSIREIRFCDPPCVRQSRIKYNDPTYLGLAYAPRVIAGLILGHREPQKMLVLGLGGGNIPNYVYHVFPNTRLDVVEMDPEVVFATEKHLGFPPTKDGRATVFSMEGMKWFETYKGQARYDVIIADACAGIPCALTTVETYMMMRDSFLTQDGILIQNVYGHQWRVFKNIQQVFKYMYLIPCRYPQINVAVIGSMKPLPNNFKNQFKFWQMRKHYISMDKESLQAIEEAIGDVIDATKPIINEQAYYLSEYKAKPTL
jgi:spermidine synthase